MLRSAILFKQPELENQIAKVTRRPSRLFAEVTSIPDLLAHSYLPSLDGFRAISIILVIVFHFLISYKSHPYFDNVANVGVQFFFVISGFLITTLLIKEQLKTGKISLKKFYVRRICRILPVAYLFLTLILLAKFLLPQHLNLVFIIASFFFVRNYFMTPTGVNHLTTHYWSLSVEEQFYIIFPVLLKVNFRLYVCFLFAIISMSLLGNILINFHIINTEKNHAFDLVFYSINQFGGMAIGSITSILLIKGIIPDVSKYVTFKITLLFILIFILCIDGPFRILKNLLISCSFAVILVLCLRASNTIYYRFLNHPTIKFVGILSFSLYIWQQPFTLNLHFFNTTHYVQSFSDKRVINLLIILSSLVSLCIVAYISYFYYEKRFLKLKQKFK
jgi:peptidoglycan/LPS O-acetylase OafA/YrhL